MVSQSFNSKLTQKLRLITKKMTSPLNKLVKPMASLLTKRNKKTTNQKAEPMTPVNRSWMHPSQLKSSEYVDCCQHQEEVDENALNEALEAKLRQLIVTEYANRRTIAPVSLHIQGHLTITPTQHEGTFWTTSSSADADICWRDCSVISHPQKAERQTPLLY
ncbi:Uncharacterized protein APZ42_020334 [Daphnia magna]|uniref:Uncharacterized protein n=2 Tax=Daphnia magna TaxID=35525 RepID=A0ABR0AFS4_9CRUS|nr:hypothetical protein OUZ56_009367 [Daphnia magna]KZS14367.1 Uncharacterized protein APZ42_020334 [Daphnia magna]